MRSSLSPCTLPTLCTLPSIRSRRAISSRVPISHTAQNIRDIGSGTGYWAREVADTFPAATIRGIDLAPVPDSWVPPNCTFEVDDILKPWELKENGKIDLVHMRHMYRAFTEQEWKFVYEEAYKNIAPAGWIEQIESNITIS